MEQCHLPALRTIGGLKVVALCDTDASRLGQLADRLGVRRRYPGYRAMLDDGGVDVVAVCTPPELHAEIALAALDAGKHLLVEKPLALSLDDADRLVERASNAPGKVLAGFNLRWHRLIRQARGLVDAGGLGPPATMHTVFTSRSAFPVHDSPWRHRHDQGGGVLFDLGIHHFDLWRFLMKCEVAEVFAQHRQDVSAVECVTVSAMMANGVMVTSSFSHGVSDTNELEICGLEARIRLSCYRFDGLRVDENGVPQGAVRDLLSGILRAVRSAPQAARALRRGGDVISSYRAEWQHFIDAIRIGTPVQPNLEDARGALQVVLAAMQSASCGRPVRVAHAARAITPSTAAAPPGRIVG